MHHMEIIQAKKGCIYIIAYIYRPNTLTFATELEHKYFSPDNSSLNELYQIFNLKYADMLYYVIELPDTKELMLNCYRLAYSLNLRLVPGKPFNGLLEFPVSCRPDACFTLETINHKEYQNMDMKCLLEQEIKNMHNKYNTNNDD